VSEYVQRHFLSILLLFDEAKRISQSKNELKKQFETLQNEKNQLSKSQQQAFTNLEIAQKKLDSQRKHAQQEIENSTKTIASLENTLKAAKESINNLENKATHTLEELTAEKKQRAEDNQAISRLSTKLEKLNAELKKLGDENNKYIGELENNLKQQEILKKTLTQKIDLLRILEETKTHQKQEIDNLRAEKETSATHAENLQEEKESLLKMREAEATAVSTAIKNWKKEKQMLSEDIKKSEELISSQKNQIDVLKTFHSLALSILNKKS